MINVHIKDNLFDETEVSRNSYEWEGKELKDYLPDGEWIVNLNGENVEDLRIIVPENSQIVISVKPEAAAAATWVVSAIGVTGVAAAVAYAVVYVAVALAVSYVGGLLMNAIMGSQKPDSSADGTAESSPTYSWEGASTLPRIGTPIPVLYGTHALAGNIIQRKVVVEGDNQYLYLLLALCEGKINDLNVNDITIDNTPLSNFTDVQWFYRNGTIGQDVLPYFGDTETPNNMSVKCTAVTPVVRQTISNSIEAFRIDLQFPNGLYYSNDSGGFDARSVMYDIEYRKVGDPTWISIGGDIYDVIWQDMDGYWGDVFGELAASLEIKTLVGHGFRQTAAKNTRIGVSHRVDNLPFGQYEIRVTRLTVDNTNARQKDDLYIANIGEIIYDDLRYPNVALFGMRIKANDQLSGNDPTISVKCTRSDIEVFNESGVSQGFKSLSNPAWVAWDILTNQDYGAGYGYNRADYNTFLEWANWNDELVPNGFGGTEKRNEFNGVFDVDSNVWDSISKVCTTGRAGMFIKGTKYIPVVDKPSLPVQMFNMGNIKKGSFSTSYIGTEDLATEVEIQFNNKDNAYVKDTLSVMVPEYFNQTQYSNKVTINQMGVTKQSQAYRIGKYFLACNKHIYRTVTFETSVDALACGVGDVIYVAHDVPAWGISGRTVGIGTINTITLDESVTLTAGKEYTLLLRQNDTDVIDKRTFVALASGLTNVITVSEDFTSVPTEYSIYTLFESSKGAQLFRISNITRATDTQDRKITAVDYNESVLSDATTIIPTTTSAISLLPHVDSLIIKEHLEIKPTGTIISFLDFEWTATGVWKDFDIMVSKDNGYSYLILAKNIIFTHHSHNITELEEGRQYLFKIVPRSVTREALDLSDVFAYTFLGKLAKPIAIENFLSSELNDDFKITWEYPTPELDFKEFRIYQNNILLGSTNSLSYNVPIIEKTSIVSVRAVDTSGVESEYTNNALTVAYLSDVTNVNTIYQNNELIAFWDEVVSNRVLSYEIRRGSSWVTAQFISTELQPKTTIYSNGTYLIKAFYVTNGGYKIESENVATLIADESQLSKNVLEFFVESDTWSGTKTNTIVTENGLTLVGESVDTYTNVDLISNFDYGNEIISQGTYESTNVVNLTVPKLCKIYSNIELEAFSINNNFDLIQNVDLVSSIDGYISADFAVEIQISISQDGSTFGAWKKFINGDYMGQSFKMRLVLSSFNTLVTPIVSYFDFTIDMPDILESGSNTSGVTTKSITYTNNFSISPEVQITILNAVQGDDAILTNETADGFDIDIKNGGSNVIRSFNYFVKGY